MKLAVFYMYMYIWCYLYKKRGVNYSRNNTNQIKNSPGLIIISLLILSNPHLYERTGNQLGENYKLN